MSTLLPLSRFARAALVAGACASLATWQVWHAHSPLEAAASSAEGVAAADASDPTRLFALIAQAPQHTPEQRLRLLHESDRIRERLAELGERDVAAALHRRLRDVKVSETEALAWYSQHRVLFGQRSFERSRHAIERLLALQHVRSELGLAVAAGR